MGPGGSNPSPTAVLARPVPVGLFLWRGELGPEGGDGCCDWG